TENNKKRTSNITISRSSLTELWIMDKEKPLSIEDISSWLKSKTDSQWTVMPRDLCICLIELLESRNNNNIEHLVSDRLKANRAMLGLNQDGEFTNPLKQLL